MRGLLLFSWLVIPRNDLPRGKTCVITGVNWKVFQIYTETLLVGLKIIVRFNNN